MLKCYQKKKKKRKKQLNPQKNVKFTEFQEKKRKKVNSESQSFIFERS